MTAVISNDWAKYTVPYTSFTAAAGNQSITLFTLPAKCIIEKVIVKHSVAFAGGSISAYTISVGDGGSATRFISGVDVFTAVADSAIYYSATTVNYYLESTTAGTAILIKATATGDNVNAATAGSVDVWVRSTEIN